MTRTPSLLAASIILLLAHAAAATAQNHVVFVQDFEFIDSVTGTNETVVCVGETIEWIWVNGNHVNIDGDPFTMPSTRFTFSLNSSSQTFQWTATTAETFPYYCLPHFGLNMIGQITVIAPTDAGVLPGSGEDLSLEVTPACVLPANAAVQMHMESPLGTFVGTQPLLAAEVFATGTPGPASPPGFPYVHLTLNALLIYDGQAGPFSPALLPAQGLTFAAVAPPTLVGYTVRIQGLCLTSTAADGIFALTDAIQLEVVAP